MSKRSSSSLTGGTGDVNPQWFNMTTTTIANDTYIQTQFPLPVQRLLQNNRSQVMEVLKVYIQVDPSIGTAATQTNFQKLVQITTKSLTASVTLEEPTLIALARFDSFNAFTAAGTYAAFGPNNPIVFDLTDGAGHGLLVATDNLYIGYDTNNVGATSKASAKILYRWKNVSETEYVGIVQSQT